MTDTINVPREYLEQVEYMLEKYVAHINSEEDELRALLQAPAQPAQVQGWQDAILKELRGVLGTDGDVYRNVEAMLAAAPQPPVHESSLREQWDSRPHAYGDSAPIQPSDDVAISKMARILSDREASACCVDPDDHWKIYSQEFIDDVLAMLEGSKGK